MDDESMANLIGQMLQLKVLKASDTQFGPLTFQAMQRDSLYQYRRVSFFESIQDLQIHQCPCVTSSMIQTILESCPNLIKLSADKVTAMDIIRGREWACVGIRELSIYLQVSNDNENLGRKDFSNEDLEVHRFVYSRLAMLTRLQKLTLTQKEGFAYYIYKRTLQLRLEAGLELLSGLKDLQSIVFSEDPHQTMRVDEAIWITENWPELRKFAGRPNDDEEICEKIKDVLETKQILVGDRELDTD
ncbi:hypothetical protein BGX26_010722 [Mortierella sp. AD094]|nr:hypothetical protein BGX26_010722 [Mortierella sp. AD094]